MPYNIPESPFYFAGASIDRDSAEGNRTQALPLCPILRQLSCLLIAQIPCDLPRCVVRAQRPAVVYCRKCQTATATPAEPGDLPIGLAGKSGFSPFCSRNEVSQRLIPPVESNGFQQFPVDLETGIVREPRRELTKSRREFSSITAKVFSLMWVSRRTGTD